MRVIPTGEPTMHPQIMKRHATWPATVAPPPRHRHFAFPRKDAAGLVVVANGSRILGVDEGRMSATAIIATPDMDRAGDVVVPDGCNLAKYRLNPVVFFGHQSIPFPVGVSEDPEGRIAVQIEPGKCVKATCYFHQATKEAVQVFDLVRLGVLRCTSVGFNPISDPVPLPKVKAELYPNAHKKPGESSLGFRYDQWELLEWSWVGIPSNPYCGILREHLSKDRLAGEPIAPLLRKHLEPLATPKKVWSPGWTKSLEESTGTSGGYAVAENLFDDDDVTTDESPETPEEEKGLFKEYDEEEQSPDVETPGPDEADSEDAVDDAPEETASPEIEKSLSFAGLQRIYKRLSPVRKQIAANLLPGLKAAYPIKTAYAVAVTKAMEQEEPEGEEQAQDAPPPPMPTAPAPVEEEEVEGLPELIAKMTEAITQIQELAAGKPTSPDLAGTPPQMPPDAGPPFDPTAQTGSDNMGLESEDGEELEDAGTDTESDEEEGDTGDDENENDGGGDETDDEILQRYKKDFTPAKVKAFMRHRDGLREAASYLTEMAQGAPSLAHKAACKLYADNLEKMCKELDAEDAATPVPDDLPTGGDFDITPDMMSEPTPDESEVSEAVEKAFEGIRQQVYNVFGRYTL